MRVYLPSNLSKYIYVCGNVGAKKAEAGGGVGTHSSSPLFSARGVGPL